MAITGKISVLLPIACFLAGCMPAELNGRKATGERITLLFYPGGNALDDLIISGGVNFFGRAQFPVNDPLGDAGFRFLDGSRVRAECITVGRDVFGDPECTEYIVYSSDFPPVPEGTIFQRPKPF